MFPRITQDLQLEDSSKLVVLHQSTLQERSRIH